MLGIRNTENVVAAKGTFTLWKRVVPVPIDPVVTSENRMTNQYISRIALKRY